jgi:hypothetical protein
VQIQLGSVDGGPGALRLMRSDYTVNKPGDVTFKVQRATAGSLPFLAQRRTDVADADLTPATPESLVTDARSCQLRLGTVEHEQGGPDPRWANYSGQSM